MHSNRLFCCHNYFFTEAIVVVVVVVVVVVGHIFSFFWFPYEAADIKSNWIA